MNRCEHKNQKWTFDFKTGNCQQCGFPLHGDETQHELTGVKLNVLFHDAASLNIDLTQESIYTLAQKCDQLTRQPEVSHPSRADTFFTTYNVYEAGTVLYTGLSVHALVAARREHPKAIVEKIFDEARYQAALDAHNT